MIDHRVSIIISRIRSHSCQVILSQASTQLINQFINVRNLKFGNTWACICEMELHMTSITEDVTVPWDTPSLHEYL